MLETFKNFDEYSDSPDLVDEWFAEAEAKWEKAEATKATKVTAESQKTIDIDDLDSS